MAKTEISDSSNCAGKVFGARYKLVSKLGAGGMGAVYRAEDNVLNKPVAVKVLLPNMQAAAMIRFHQEAKATARLNHKNILNVFDFGQSDNGELYLVMDYLDGQSLTDLLKATGALEPAAAVPIFIQICSGMEHAHSLGILHRDIKPSNIMLLDDGRGFMQAKIVDFGLAKMESDEQSLTTTGARIGSPLYMSPEQCNGDEVDHRSDIYSIGVLMYRTLTGKVPFQGDSFLDTLSKHMHEEPKDINENERDLSFGEDLAAVVSKALEKNPADRFQTCEELQAALLALDLAPPKVQTEGAGENSDDTAYGEVSKTHKKRTVQFALIAAVCLIPFALFMMSKFEDMNKTEQVSPPKLKEDKNLIAQYLADEFVEYKDEGKNWIKCAVTFQDDSMPNIAREVQYKHINFTGAEISGKNLDLLLNRPIEDLDLSRTLVNDQAMPQVAKMTELKGFWVNGDDITDKGIEPISTLKNLKELGLRNTLITDKALETIRKMQGLEVLDIGFCDKISAAGLNQLTGLKSLQTLYLPDCTRLKSFDIEKFKGVTGVHVVEVVTNYHPKRANWQKGYFTRRVEKAVNRFGDSQWWNDMNDPEFLAFFKGRKNFDLTKKEIARIKNPRIKKYFTDPQYIAALKQPKFRNALSNPTEHTKFHKMEDWFSRSLVERDELLKENGGRQKGDPGLFARFAEDREQQQNGKADASTFPPN